MPDQTQPIQSATDFDATPAGRQLRWNAEIKAAKKAVEDFHARGKKILERFQDKRPEARTHGDTRVNLFTSNIQTQRAMMYGKTPRCEVSRRYADPDDDVARVAALMLTRHLNLDIETDTDDYAAALALVLDDFQLVGLGMARVRYEAEFDTQPAQPAQMGDCPNCQGQGSAVGELTGESVTCPQCQGQGQVELAPAVPEQEVKTSEGVHVDYTHWRDLLWSPARVWHEVRWVGYGAELSNDDFDKRFPGKRAKVAANTSKLADREDGLKHDPWERIRVWEIWSKEDRKVYWYAEGATEILDEKDDPLKLAGFFPSPRPLAANVTTDSFMPVPDFVLAQDIYDEIDFVSTRITWLERACKVVGVYDSTSEGVKAMLQEGTDNQLIPVDGWAMHAERGGIKGQVEWLPLDQIVGAMDKLRDYRTELVQLLYETTGMSDIMRGSSDAQETATAQAIKAKFASTRMQARQDEFARFATDLLKLKSEILLTLCEDEFILKGSNIEHTVDAPLAPQALQLLRDSSAKFRIEVKPENLSITNFKDMQTERMSVLQGVTGYLQAVAPLVQGAPETAPFLLELLKWTVAGFHGASSIESVIDQQVAQVKQKLANPPPPQEDPKLQAQREKAQLDVGVAKTKAKVEISKLQQKQQIDQQQLGLDKQRMDLDIQKQMRQMQLDAMRPEPTPGQQPAADPHHQGM